MNELFYEMIFKRKSFHIFKDINENKSMDEINEIQEIYKTLTPLIGNIKRRLKLYKVIKRLVREDKNTVFYFIVKKRTTSYKILVI